MVDLLVIAIYLLGMIGIGIYFSRKKQNTEQFTKAPATSSAWEVSM
jgi:SSS family solute:Na+ symporter